MRSHDQPRRGRWTVADIGGTHARLARWSALTGLDTAVRVRNDDYDGPRALLESWFQHDPGRTRRLLLALAMPVGVDTMTLTNRAWRFEPHEKGARVRFKIAYQFKNPVLQALVAANKNKLAARIMSEFESEARRRLVKHTV